MSVMLTIINVMCSWIGLFACAGYVCACVRGMLNGEAFTPLAIVMLVVSVVVVWCCGGWIICH